MYNQNQQVALGQTNKQNKQTTHRIVEIKAGQTDLKFRSRAASQRPCATEVRMRQTQAYATATSSPNRHDSLSRH